MEEREQLSSSVFSGNLHVSSQDDLQRSCSEQNVRQTGHRCPYSVSDVEYHDESWYARKHPGGMRLQKKRDIVASVIFMQQRQCKLV